MGEFPSLPDISVIERIDAGILRSHVRAPKSSYGLDHFSLFPYSMRRTRILTPFWMIVETRLKLGQYSYLLHY